MNILIDISHPAHVHFFKHAARVWQEHGHQVKFVARNKEITFQLLDDYHIPYQGLSTIRKGLPGLAVEMVEHQSRLVRVAREFKPDVMLNIGGTFIVHAGKLMGIKTVVFTDTEHAKLSNGITFPFATWICTPQAFMNDLGKKQVRYNGYQELAYLHPNQFTPNPHTLEECGLDIDEKFYVLRFVSWGASHDVGQVGLSVQDKINLVESLLQHGKVLITSESPLPEVLEPYKVHISPTRIHDLLYYASMYVGEGATMASEAAILGTPSVYINPLGSGNIDEICDQYKLMYHYSQGQSAIEMVKILIGVENLKRIQMDNRQRMLKEKIDVTSWIVDFIESIGER
jgi:hypothetical protein